MSLRLRGNGESVALTRKLLKSMGIEDEKIDQIIEAHTETVDALKAERDQAKADSAKLKDVERELEAIKSAPGDDFQAKYESEHKAFEDYKAEVKAQQAHDEKARLYRGLLREAGVDEKRIDSVMRVADLDKVSVKDGAIEDHDKALEGIKGEWGDFIPQTQTKPAQVQTPPASAGGEKEPHSLAEALRQKYAK